MSVEMLKSAKKVIGLKQTTKAINKGIAKRVYLAADADKRIIVPLQELCEQNNITAETVLTMKELGQACGIEVGAAAVAVVGDEKC